MCPTEHDAAGPSNPARGDAHFAPGETPDLDAALLDPARLAALQRTALLDSLPEEAFDRLTRLATTLIKTPVALVSLVDDRRQFFKSKVGLAITGTPLSHSFCKHVVAQRAPLIIDNAREHPLVWDNPVIEAAGVVAYLGIPLATPDGSVIGSLCAIDHVPRAWSAADVATLEELARITMSEIALRLAGREQEEAATALRESEQFARSTVDALSCHLCILDERGIIIAVNRGWREFAEANPPLASNYGPGADYLAVCDKARSSDEAAKMAAGVRRVLAGAAEEFVIEYPCHAPTERRWFLGRVTAFADDGPRRVVVAHENITARRHAEALRDEAEVQIRGLSRAAGMAEVASGVLHNVGNVLNSANVSLEVATTGARQLKAPSLAKAAALLQEHTGDLAAFLGNHPQGAKFPAFLAQLAGHFTAQQAALLQELGALRSSVEHINQIVAMQQKYASAGGVTEELAVTELIEDALRLDAASLDRRGLQVVCNFDTSIGHASLDRHKMLQILVNLIRNAKQAMDRPEASGKALTVRTAKIDDASFSIAVIDQGMGVAPENLARIFQHGFTTKKEGHGFGLHASALAARQMGGDLRVESPGPGCGATFTLTLPLLAQAA